jgi:hypothetical protein
MKKPAGWFAICSVNFSGIECRRGGRYHKDVIVVEYSHNKEEVNKIAFVLHDGKRKSTCIWEPLSTWEKVFDDKGKSNELMKLYVEISEKYLKGKK